MIRRVVFLIKNVKDVLLQAFQLRMCKQLLKDGQGIPLGDRGIDSELNPWMLHEPLYELDVVRSNIVVVLPYFEVWLSVAFNLCTTPEQDATANVH